MLDIIIPVYNNIKGLEDSLQSIGSTFNNEITITLVDDASTTNYTELLNKYPYVHYYKLETNSGPGIARQYGIEHTNEPYIYFLDAGCTFLKLDNMLATIKDYPNIKMFSWSTFDEYGNVRKPGTEITGGHVYLRSFIQQYGICFCAESSYANEDLGFIRACLLILKANSDLGSYLEIPTPMIREDFNKESLTKKNNNEFCFRHCVKGISLNCQHVIAIGEKNGVPQELLKEEIKAIVPKLLFFSSLTARGRLNFLREVHKDLKDFYKNFYIKYCGRNAEIEQRF